MEHVIIFTDIRGFTTWADDVETHPILSDFAGAFQELIREQFETNSELLEHRKVKNEGDGAMIVLEVMKEPRRAVWVEVLKEVVSKIKVVNERFAALCRETGADRGIKIDLRLGWGVVKGAIQATKDDDFIGAAINKSARLCGLARPFGVVIDADNFQEADGCGLKLCRQTRKLKGVRKDANVWVTQEISTQFITRESMRLMPEVHVAGVCYKTETGEVLIAKRNDDRKILPGLYEGCGGQLAPNETFADGVVRHFAQELQLQVKAVEDCHVFYTIRQPNMPMIPGIFFLCLYKEGEEVSANHSELRWVRMEHLEDVKEADCVPGLRQQIRDLMRLYANKG